MPEAPVGGIQGRRGGSPPGQGAIQRTRLVIRVRSDRACCLRFGSGEGAIQARPDRCRFFSADH
eukprot:3645122-Alexandrium_andersonii.AAC.1